MDDPPSCRNCKAAFDYDIALLRSNSSSDHHRLPVSCMNCPFSVCHACFQGWFEVWKSKLRIHEKKRSSVECPDCDAVDGFDMLKPNISHFACSLLEAAELARQPATPPTSRAPITPLARLSTAVVTPSKPSRDHISSDRTAAAAPLKREASDDDDSATLDIKPPAAKRKKKNAPKYPLHITEAEREMLKKECWTGWVEDMQVWLKEVDETSKKNESTVLRQVRKLAAGEGIGYKSVWPEDVVFQEGIKVDLSMNFDRMMEKGKDYEAMFGRDKGNGWLVRHPIGKLAKYQRYVVVEKLRKGKPWPLQNGIEGQLQQVVNAEESASLTSTDETPFPKGTKVCHEFVDDGWFEGEVISYSKKTNKYHVQYEGGDERDWFHDDIVPWVKAAREKM